MKYLLVIILLINCLYLSVAQQITYPRKQNKSIVRIPELYDSYGKIFSNKNFLIPFDAQRIVTPTPEDVCLSELLMSKEFNALVKRDDRLKALGGKTYKEYYRHYYRQYVCFIDKFGDRVIAIHYIRCCRKRIKSCFPNWKEELGNPLDEDPCTITNTFLVNVTHNAVSLP